MAGIRDISESEVVWASRGVAEGMCKALSIPTHQACLVHACATVFTLRERGVRAILQAGSCSWPRLRPDQDDGKETTYTHFTYDFAALTQAEVMHALLAGRLPEIHVWCAVPPHHLIDTSTRYLPEACREMTGMDWPGTLPPDYLWCDIRKGLPDGVLYRPVPAACKIALQYACSLLGDLDGEAARILTGR